MANPYPATCHLPFAESAYAVIPFTLSLFLAPTGISLCGVLRKELVLVLTLFYFIIYIISYFFVFVKRFERVLTEYPFSLFNGQHFHVRVLKHGNKAFFRHVFVYFDKNAILFIVPFRRANAVYKRDFRRHMVCAALTAKVVYFDDFFHNKTSLLVP